MNEATFGWKWVTYCLLKRTHLAETGFFFTVQVCNDVFQKDEGVVLGKKLFISVSKVYKDENFLDFAKLHFWWKKNTKMKFDAIWYSTNSKVATKIDHEKQFFQKTLNTHVCVFKRSFFFGCILQQLSFNMVISWWQEWRKSALSKVFAIRENVDKSNY